MITLIIYLWAPKIKGDSTPPTFQLLLLHSCFQECWLRPQLLRQLCLYRNTRTKIYVLVYLFAWVALCCYFKASVHSQGLNYHKFFPCLHLFTHFPIREEINNFRNGLESVHVLIITNIYIYIGRCKKISKTGCGSCHYQQNQ